MENRDKEFTFTSERKKSQKPQKNGAAAHNVKKTGVVSCYLNIRKRPNGDIVRVAEPGEKLTYTDVRNGWAALDDGNYCMVKYLD